MGEIPEVSGNETMIETKARRDVERVVARFSRPLDYWLLWLLVLGSLGLNLYLLQTLLDLRDRAGQAVGDVQPARVPADGHSMGTTPGGQEPDLAHGHRIDD